MTTETTRTTETPRETRRRLNQMERWVERHASFLGPEAVRLRALFEVAFTTAHADHLAGELRDLAAHHNLTS